MLNRKSIPFYLKLNTHYEDGWMKLTPTQRHQLFRFIWQYREHYLTRNKNVRISPKGVSPLKSGKSKDPFKNYTFVKYLGEGAYGEVNLYKKNDRVYAVKKVDNSDYEDTLNEILVSLLLCNHEHAIRLRKILITDDSTYIIMEPLTFATDEEFREARQNAYNMFSDLGVHVICRDRANTMARVENGKRTPVEIDYGFSKWNYDTTESFLRELAEADELSHSCLRNFRCFLSKK